MRMKFVATEDLEELEATANMLLLEGWEISTSINLLPNGKYLMAFQKWEPRTSGSIAGSCQATEPIAQRDVPREVRR